MFTKRSCFRLMCVVVLLAAAVLPSAGAHSGECHHDVDYANAAMTAYEAGAYEDALPDLRCAAGLDLQNIDLQAAYFQALLRLGRITSAYTPAAVLSSLDPGRFAQIIADAEAALAEDPTDRGAMYILLGSRIPIEDADIERLLELDPNSAIGYAYRATKAAFYDGDMEAARVAIERAIELAPENPEILSQATYVYAFGIGDADRALELIEQALALDPNYAPSYADRAFLYEQAGEFSLAIETIERAISLNPYDYTYYNIRGLLYSEEENYPAALEDFRYVLSVNPASPTALGSLIELSLTTGIPEDRVLAAESFLNARTELVAGDRLTAETPVTLTMTAGRMTQILVTLEAGQVVEISAAAADPESLDPLLMVVDPEGAAVAYNDDLDSSGDPAEGAYNAAISFTPEMRGVYTLLATHAGAGSEGEMTITITHLD